MSTRPSILGIGAAAALAAIAAACRPAPAPEVVCPDCNVLLIVVDTLRADHLGSYGYRRPTSPQLDAFAASNLRFDNVHSQSACTFPSVNSLLTSQPTFGFTDPATRPAIPDHVLSLPRLLAARGYRTAAVSASPIVRATPTRFNKVGGFGQGFDTFHEGCVWRGAPCVNRQALATLQKLPPPWFLYLHYMDPHDPYRPPEHVRGTFSAPYSGGHDFVRDGNPNPLARLIREGDTAAVEAATDAANLKHLVDLYDEMILAFDTAFGHLMRALERAGRLEDTIVVIASDHGEAFYEHGVVKHCYTVYDNETRVPLIVHLPPAPAPRVIQGAAQNLDIVPTIVDWLGIDPAPFEFAGTSLRALIEGDGTPSPERLAYSAMGNYRSVNDHRYKLISDLRGERFRLFDLLADPGETTDVLHRERRRFRHLQERLRAWRLLAEGGEDDQRQRWSEEIEKELRALGYLG